MELPFHPLEEGHWIHPGLERPILLLVHDWEGCPLLSAGVSMNRTSAGLMLICEFISFLPVPEPDLSGGGTLLPWVGALQMEVCVLLLLCVCVFSRRQAQCSFAYF